MAETEQYTNKTDGTKYLVKVKATIQYTAEEAPDEDKVISPITRFIRKTAKTYKGKIIGIATGVCDEDYILDDGEQDEEE